MMTRLLHRLHPEAAAIAALDLTLRWPRQRPSKGDPAGATCFEAFRHAKGTSA